MVRGQHIMRTILKGGYVGKVRTSALRSELTH